MLKVRQAVLEDIPAIVALYDGIIERFQAQTGTAAWRKGRRCAAFRTTRRRDI